MTHPDASVRSERRPRLLSESRNGSRRSGKRRATVVNRHRAVVDVITAMSTDPGKPWTLDEMARRASYSPFHFHRIFQDVTRLTPGEFLTALRLQEAKRLLLATTWSISRICFTVGYNSLGSFTYRFSQLVGLPPGRFRRAGLDLADTAEPTRELSRFRSKNRSPGALAVKVRPDADRSGILVGALFRNPVPMGRPPACATATRANPGLELGTASSGPYYAFVTVIPTDVTATDLVLCRGALRGSVGPIDVARRTEAPSVSLRLHAPRTTDPPPLVAFPLLQLADIG